MSANPKKIYSFKINQILDHTHNIRELELILLNDDQFHFRAGQFAMLHVPTETGKPVLRAYSIASGDQQKNGFRLLFKYIPGGIASEYIWSLKGHETLSMTGPFGRLFFAEPPTDKILFLNTGTGLSQHLSYLFSFKEKYPNIKYQMLLGCRTQKDIYLVETMEKLKSQIKNFQYEFVLSQAESDWKGKTGYLQEHLKKIDLTETTVYMCGNGSMIKDAKLYMESIGVDKSRVWAEAFD